MLKCKAFMSGEDTYWMLTKQLPFITAQNISLKKQIKYYKNVHVNGAYHVKAWRETAGVLLPLYIYTRRLQVYRKRGHSAVDIWRIKSASEVIRWPLPDTNVSLIQVILSQTVLYPSHPEYKQCWVCIQATHSTPNIINNKRSCHSDVSHL